MEIQQLLIVELRVVGHYRAPLLSCLGTPAARTVNRLEDIQYSCSQRSNSPWKQSRKLTVIIFDPCVGCIGGFDPKQIIHRTDL